MLAPLNSASAISAALRMDWPAIPALPPADRGRTTATLTAPAPSGAATDAGAAAGASSPGELLPSRLEAPPQPASKAATAKAAARHHGEQPRGAAGLWQGINRSPS